MSDSGNVSKPRKNQFKGLKFFGVDKPAIPGPGRPPLPPEVKAERKEAREILKNAAPRFAQRIVELSESRDDHTAISALKVGLDKVLPNLEEVETNDNRPLQVFTDEQLQRQLDAIRSSRNGAHSGNGASPQ